MLKKLLIANRGEIACRIIRSAKRLGVETVAVYSDIDALAPHVQMADQAVCLGGTHATENYLDIDAILGAGLQTGADSIHPGYGFLAENHSFAKRVVESGLIFVGPSAESIQVMGSKIQAKQLVIQAGVPVVPGYGGESQEQELLESEARKIGFPLLIKASAGGGGKGMRLVVDANDFNASAMAARREAQASFGDDRILLEKFLVEARHIEVQILADKFGNTVHLFERNCSVQRRHQKVLEEAPAPDLSDQQRKQIC